jgi:Phage portal protein/ParB-like nuclease domain
MATNIYGPDGSVVHVVGGAPVDTPDALRKLDHNAMLAEVAKRVKSQATTLSQVWDPARGKPKPTSVTYTTLRTMAQRCEWARAIIKTRRKQVGKAKWSIVPKDPDDTSRGVQALCEKITNLLRHPSMHGSRPSSRSWKQFMAEYTEDILVLDQGCIEKEWTLDKWIAAMYPVDGATIAPNMDERGGYHDDAYVQTVDGQITARFGVEDLIFTMDNPQTDVRFAGYGYSPLEYLIVSVTAELYSSKYNASYFEKGAVPEGMINLGPEAAPEDVNAFRLYWMNEIMGRPWAIPILGGSKAEWIPWRASNKDMEYMAYQEWLLKKFCAIFQMSPKEMGLVEDVNRSTAESEDSSEEQKGVEPLLELIEDTFEVEVIGEHGLGVGDYVEFKFDEEGESEAEILNRFSVMIPMGAATRQEMREALNMPPGEDEGLDEFLVEGEVLPLPSGADLEALGAANKQQVESEEAERQFGLAKADQAHGQKMDQLEHKRQSKETDAKAKALSKSPAPAKGKVGKVFDRHNPELLEQQADAERIFEDANGSLMRELQNILNVPLGKTVHEPPRLQRVRLADLQVDLDYQRPEDRGKVEGMLKAIRDGKELPPPEVNEREDGSRWITDGQHRVKARMLNGETEADALITRDPQQSEPRRANLLTAHV